MNKDEAERCLKISKEKFEEGNTEAAMEFLNKNSSYKPAPKAPAASSKPSNASGSTSKAAASETPSRPYTPDQVEGIKRIKDMKAKGDLYGVLGLQKGCEESDIKKAYRKVGS
ncbi:hypothetical protein HDU96_009715 [Phlyctochytrium bullatum]|nr:hypothetical protein HDU96_009715 [Phlyctochytrium bullatum]